MKFFQAFETSSFLLLLTGLAALATAGGVGPVPTLAYLILLLIGCRIRLRPMGSGVQTLVVAGLLTGALLDAVFLSGFVPATIHLLLLLSAFKVLTRRSDRDYLLLYFISFAFLLIASTFTISAIYLACLVAFLFFSILAFVLFEGRSAYEENPNADFALQGYVGVSLVMSGLIILLSIPIFLAVPRSAFGFFTDQSNRNGNLSGFSNRVSLGDIGKILTNPEVVLRVKVDREPDMIPSSLKWRGVGLNHYDGRVWTNTNLEHSPELWRNPQQGILVARSRRQEEFQIRQTFLREPFTSVLFGAPQMISIVGPGLHRRLIFRDGNDSFSIQPGASESVQYTVYSDLISRLEQAHLIRTGSYSSEMIDTFLQLPPLDPRIPELAGRLASGQDSAFARAMAIETYLRQDHAYSLGNASGFAPDPLADFLFETKAGHCEYFATAQAVLMRAAGIPSRVVNGFRRGEFNEWGGYFIVRQSDAHSWVEGFFPGAGWIEFDATPASLESREFAAQYLIGQLLDTLNVFWSEVVTFDRFKQVGFFQYLGYQLRGGWQSVLSLSTGLARLDRLDWNTISRGLLESSREVAFLLFALIAAGVGLRYRRYLKAFWIRRVLNQPLSDVAPEYYREMLDILARRGYVKASFETPGEFVQRIGQEIGSSVPIGITELYYRSRFGDAALGPDELTWIHSGLRNLRR